MRVIYVAHPLSAPTREGIEANRERASRWVSLLARTFKVAPVCTWIVLTGQWEETEENRALGLAIDCELVAACDECWLVGGRVSSGMGLESKHSTHVVDLTFLGEEPPSEVHDLDGPTFCKLRDLVGAKLFREAA